MTPRGDNALFYGLVAAALTSIIFVPFVLYPLLSVFFHPSLLLLETIQLGLPPIAGVIAYGITWKRGEGKQRQREGRCITCRYDLTANVSGLCPECGNVVKRGESERRV